MNNEGLLLMIAACLAPLRPPSGHASSDLTGWRGLALWLCAEYGSLRSFLHLPAWDVGTWRQALKPSKSETESPSVESFLSSLCEE